MHTRFWLAGTATAVLVAAGAIVASPIVHGQTASPAAADTDTSAQNLRVSAREISEAVQDAVRQVDVLRTVDIQDDVRRAVEEAQQVAQDVVRDLDVEVLVENAAQGAAGLPALGGQPRLGVSTRDLTAEEAKGAGLTGIAGAWVSDVAAGSAAGKAGLQSGDVILSVDGETVRSARHLARLVAETPEGRALQVTYLRGGAKNTVSVTPETRAFTFDFRGPGPEGPTVRRFERRLPEGRERGDRERFEFFGPGQEFFFRHGPEGGARIWISRGRLGIVAQPLTGQLATYFGVTDGVLVTSVNENTPAAKAGIRAGDVVTAVNGKPVKDPGDVIDHLQGVDEGKTVPVEITRDKKRQTVTVTLETPSNTSGDRPVIRRPRFTA